MTTTGLSTLVNRVQTSPGAERLEARRSRVRLLQLVQDIFEVGLRVSFVEIMRCQAHIGWFKPIKRGSHVLHISCCATGGTRQLTSYMVCSRRPVKPIAMAWATRGCTSASIEWRSHVSSPSIAAGELGNRSTESRAARQRGESLVRVTDLILSACELSSDSSISYRDGQSLFISSARGNRGASLTFLAELLESATMDVLPPSRAPYVSCARGCSSARHDSTR